MLQACTCGTDSAGNHTADCPLNPNYGKGWNITTGTGIPEQKMMWPARTGWVCPKCGIGVSPDSETCPCLDRTVYQVVKQAVLEIKDDGDR